MQDHRVGNGAIASTAECFERHKTTSQWDLTQIKRKTTQILITQLLALP